MKKVISTICLCATALLNAVDKPNPARRVRLPPEELAKRHAERAERRAERIRQNGGIVEAPYNGKYVVVVDAQKKVGRKPFEEFAQSMFSGLRFPTRIKTGGGVAWPVTGMDAGITILVAERGEDPILLVAPESGWAVLNMTALSADNPPQDILEGRTMKEMWRAACYVLGAANSMSPSCVMTDVFTPKDLDEIQVYAPSPEHFGKMSANAFKRGISYKRSELYSKACEEGWAPAPTNDVQKAIWEKVKSDKERGPTTPITIQPPKAK